MRHALTATKRIVVMIAFGLMSTSICAIAAETSKTTPQAQTSKPGAETKVTAPSVPKIEALSATQRNSLSDATSVMLPTGRVATLAVLRKEHALRLARFSNAKQLGAKILAGRPKATATAGGGNASNVLVSMKVPSGYALDYEDFCLASKSSGCLYFPGPANLYASANFPVAASLANGVLYDYDPLVTDAGVCGSQFGKFVSGACYYPYPAKYSANFNPGPPVTGQPIGSGISSQQNCMSPLTLTLDPHGAIEMSYNLYALEIQSIVSCVVWVYAPPPV